MCSATYVFNFKENHNYITCADSNNNIYLCTKDNYKDNIISEGYLVTKNNIHIFNLLSSSYCQLALDHIFSKDDIKLYNDIKNEFNITIPVNKDKDYIEFVKDFLIKEGVIVG